MSNMSYCRFQNTLNDLRECYESLAADDDLSENEQKAKDKLIKMCGNIYSDFGPDLEDEG